MRTGKTAVGAIGAEMRAVASEATRTNLFEMIAKHKPLCIWESDGCWHADFDEAPRAGPWVIKISLLWSVTRAMKEEAKSLFSDDPGLVDLVIYDTCEFYERQMAKIAAGL